MVEGLAACFAGLSDPRETSRCDHQLIDILAIAVCAVVACAESWEDIELYGRSKRAWLETFLALPNGIPSHDTFRRVFDYLLVLKANHGRAFEAVREHFERTCFGDRPDADRHTCRPATSMSRLSAALVARDPAYLTLTRDRRVSAK